MPRVKQVTAAKDYPKFGIVKGQKHYHWKRKTGPYTSQEYRQVEPPRIEQLTSSSYKIAMHHIQAAMSSLNGPEDMDGVIQMVEDLASEQREKFDNMPEGLQQGDTGQALEQQADTLDSAKEELEQIKSDWEQAVSDHETEVSAYEETQEAYEAWEAADDEEAPEPTVEEDPGEFDHDEWASKVSDVQLEA